MLKKGKKQPHQFHPLYFSVSLSLLNYEMQRWWSWILSTRMTSIIRNYGKWCHPFVLLLSFCFFFIFCMSISSCSKWFGSFFYEWMCVVGIKIFSFVIVDSWAVLLQPKMMKTFAERKKNINYHTFHFALNTPTDFSLPLIPYFCCRVIVFHPLAMQKYDDAWQKNVWQATKRNCAKKSFKRKWTNSN